MAWLNLELIDSQGGALSGRAFTLEFADAKKTGSLDEQGRLAVEVPEGTSRATLVVAYKRIDLVLGPLPGADTVRGAQERLNQLNFFCGEVDGELGPFTQRALQRFQRSCEIDATGELDAATTKQLVQEHGA